MFVATTWTAMYTSRCLQKSFLSVVAVWPSTARGGGDSTPRAPAREAKRVAASLQSGTRTKFFLAGRASPGESQKSEIYTQILDPSALSIAWVPPPAAGGRLRGGREAGPLLCHTLPHTGPQNSPANSTPPSVQVPPPQRKYPFALGAPRPVHGSTAHARQKRRLPNSPSTSPSCFPFTLFSIPHPLPPLPTISYTNPSSSTPKFTPFSPILFCYITTPPACSSSTLPFLFSHPPYNIDCFCYTSCTSSPITPTKP